MILINNVSIYTDPNNVSVWYKCFYYVSSVEDLKIIRYILSELHECKPGNIDLIYIEVEANQLHKNITNEKNRKRKKGRKTNFKNL